MDVAAECLPAYGSFFSSAAVADGDAMATDVDVEMTAACGSVSYTHLDVYKRQPYTLLLLRSFFLVVFLTHLYTPLQIQV